MKRQISRLADEAFDVLVIGGGILGAGIARDATLRGLKVALVEKSDFASGTSSRSTKLIHGGFRYLEQREIRLVAEACRERAILQRQATHLVHPQSFLLPVYDRDPRPLWKIRCGMTLYDRLAWQAAAQRHRRLSADETTAAEPLLSRQGLRGAVLFYDCQMDDARLCLETALDAGRRGAICANYCEVIGAERIRNRVTRVWVRDRLTEKQLCVRADSFVNAGGPWIEQVVGLAAWDTRPVALSPTKGVHLVLPRVTREHGIFFQSRYDNRMLFLIPWDDRSLLGTTDTDYHGDPGLARANRGDVEYLLGRLHDVMPDCGASPSDIVASFAGVRPLLRADLESPSNRSREYRLIQHGDNFLSVAGGKYTTFRAIADRAVQKLFKLLARKPPPCSTATTPLVDRRAAPHGALIADSPPVYVSQVVQACEQELAVTVIDVMRRRTTLALGPHGGPEVADRVSRVMAATLRWEEALRQRMSADYSKEWQRNRAWMTDPL